MRKTTIHAALCGHRKNTLHVVIVQINTKNEQKKQLTVSDRPAVVVKADNESFQQTPRIRPHCFFIYLQKTVEIGTHLEQLS